MIRVLPEIDVGRRGGGKEGAVTRQGALKEVQGVNKMAAGHLSVRGGSLGRSVDHLNDFILHTREDRSRF